MSDVVHVSTSEPGPRRSSKWLDVPRLTSDLRDVAALARDAKGRRAEKLRRGEGVLVEEWGLASMREHATLLATLRAMHRGKRHVGRHRVFGPDHPNGTAIVDGPIVIPQDYLDRYAVKAT